jgi:P4 family phage/plasmid primase-like protien
MDWFQYAGHTWKNLKSAMRLRERLSNEVRDKYLLAGRDCRDKITQATEQDERDRHDEKLKKLNKIESSLQTSGFKDCVMKEITEKFYDEDFLQHMNQNPVTVGFSNGVLELRHAGDDGQPHVHFRPGQPDDCISFQMGRGMVGLDAIPFLEGPLAYNPEAPNQPPEYAEIMSFFSKIYPDPVLREYCLTLYAACLEGANREQKFYILTGVGSNGKSKIVELLSKTFGEYQESMGTTAITRKRPDSGAANPDLVVLKCKRFVSMSEPDEGEKINTASMKQLSGEDVVKARALFQDQDQFVIMARIFMLCNDLPPVSSTDGGTWRRLRVIPHVARFIDVDATPDPTNHVYHKDLMLDGKIAKWRPYFASILVWYYENKYLRGGLKEPEHVASASKKYKEENDAFAAFCQDCLIKETGAEIRANELLVRYKEWNKYNPGKKLMTKPALLQKMSDTYGSIEGGKVFLGVRLVEDGEDISGNYM